MSDDNTLTVLELRKVVNASCEQVFDALTKPELINQWMFGMDEGHADIDCDIQPGGKYILNMVRPNGEVAYSPHGEYLEIDPPNKISMTWCSEGFIDHSILSFELVSTETGTEIIIRHELPRFTVADHRDGWTTCLNHCERLFSK